MHVVGTQIIYPLLEVKPWDVLQLDYFYTLHGSAVWGFGPSDVLELQFVLTCNSDSDVRATAEQTAPRRLHSEDTASTKWRLSPDHLKGGNSPLLSAKGLSTRRWGISSFKEECICPSVACALALPGWHLIWWWSGDLKQLCLMSGVHLKSQSRDVGHVSCGQSSQGCGRRTDDHEALTGAGGRALTLSSFTWPEVCRPYADNRQQR